MKSLSILFLFLSPLVRADYINLPPSGGGVTINSCSAGQYAYGIGSTGLLSCSTPSAPSLTAPNIQTLSYYVTPFTCKVTNGNVMCGTVSSFTGLYVGQGISGTDIAAGAYITALNIGASTLTMSAGATGGTATTVTVTPSGSGTYTVVGSPLYAVVEAQAAGGGGGGSWDGGDSPNPGAGVTGGNATFGTSCITAGGGVGGVAAGSGGDGNPGSAGGTNTLGSCGTVMQNLPGSAGNGSFTNTTTSGIDAAGACGGWSFLGGVACSGGNWSSSSPAGGNGLLGGGGQSGAMSKFFGDTGTGGGGGGYLKAMIPLPTGTYAFSIPGPAAGGTAGGEGFAGGNSGAGRITVTLYYQ